MSNPVLILAAVWLGCFVMNVLLTKLLVYLEPEEKKEIDENFMMVISVLSPLALFLLILVLIQHFLKR